VASVNLVNMLKRTQNFSVEERSLLLLDLVDRYRSLIENKRTDACTNAVRTDRALLSIVDW